MRMSSIGRALFGATALFLGHPAFADNCPALAGKTMCITAANNWGGSWAMNASFGDFDAATAQGSATIAGNPGVYYCPGNNFARIVAKDTTNERIVWIAVVKNKAKSADGTGYTQGSESIHRYRAVSGACPAQD